MMLVQRTLLVPKIAKYSNMTKPAKPQILVFYLIDTMLSQIKKPK